MIEKINRKKTRQLRIRKKVSGTGNKPRLTVFRSNKYLWAQIIDDENNKTLLGVSDKKAKSATKVQKAKETGLLIAKAAIKKNLKNVVFDRSGYKYHGRVKALAEGAREGGLIF